jgi:hypothetical protein
MMLEIFPSTLISFGALGSRATSDTAHYVSEQALRGRRHLQESFTLGLRGKGAFDGLSQVYEECIEPNWDGYDALPVTEDSYRLTYELLETLPLSTPPPSFGAEPDGHITLEWRSSPTRTLSVSVSPEGELHYAALLGDSRAYGTEPFFGEVPKPIVDLIHRVMAA